MNKFLVTSVLLVVLNLTVVKVKAEPKVEAGVTATGCVNCGAAASAQAVDIKKDATEMLAFIKNPIDCTDKATGKVQTDSACMLINWLKWKHSDYAPNCKNFFIDANTGMLGKYSQLTTGLMFDDVAEEGGASVLLMDNDDLRKYCPGYSAFTTAQKVAFHGWVFELTAFPESSCKVDVKDNTHAPTTSAVCMFQLEDKPDIRKWRSAGFKTKRCAVSEAEVRTIEGCIGCAFDEYKRKIKKHGTPFGTFDKTTGKRINGSYWASHNLLPPKDRECFLKYPNTQKGASKPDWLLKCPGANWEWAPRVKFFERIQRFPLCQTPAAAEERKKLAAWMENPSAKK